MNQDARPSAPFSSSSSGETPLVVGLDLGGTKMAAALVDADGTLRGPAASCSTPAHDGPAAMLDSISALVQRVEVFRFHGDILSRGVFIRPVAEMRGRGRHDTPYS